MALKVISQRTMDLAHAGESHSEILSALEEAVAKAEKTQNFRGTAIVQDAVCERCTLPIKPSQKGYELKFKPWEEAERFYLHDPDCDTYQPDYFEEVASVYSLYSSVSNN